MPEPLRLLVVDDAPEHARMVEEFIRSTEAWADANVRIAISYDEALEAFKEQEFDVAFFDYLLGARDGLSLLREIRHKGIDTPVIVLTSRGAEDVAVEAMKTGAADYLSKANLTVEALDRTIRHALALHAEEVQRWHAEAALRASEERFRALVENSSDALLLIDAEGRVKYMTPSSVRHLGWTPEQLIGRSILEFMHPDDAERVAGRIRESLDLPGKSLAG
jgi:DNA-binding NtrC family response regulator